MNSELNKNFPPPEIPSDEAWAKMKSLLDAELPIEPGSAAKGTAGSGGNIFWKIMFFVSGTAFVFIISFFVITSDLFKNNEVAVNTPEIVSTESTYKEFNNPEQSENNQTVQKETGKENNQTEKLNFQLPQNDVNSKVEDDNSNQKKEIKLIENYDELKNNQALKTTSEIVSKELLTNLANETNQQIDTKSEQFAEEAAINSNVDKKAVKDENKEPVLIDNEKKQAFQETKQAEVNNPPVFDEDQKPKAGKNDNQNSTEIINQKNEQQSGGFFSHTHVGVQWNLPIPVQGTEYYFSGYKGNNEPYLILIPGIWLNYDAGKSEIMVQITPCSPTFTGKKALISIVAVHDSLPYDSLQTEYISTTYLYKTFGLGIRLQYNFEISHSFVIGAGINYTFLFKALEKTTLSIGQTETDSLFGTKKASNNWNYIQSGFLSGNIEAAWRIKKIDLGINFSFPLTNISSNNNLHIKPINAQVFIRWRIW